MKHRLIKLENKILPPKKEAHIFIEIEPGIFQDSTGNRCKRAEIDAKNTNHDYIFVVKADTKRD